MQKFIIQVPDDKTHLVKEFLEEMGVTVVKTSNSSVSPEEVIAAGGATAFGIQSGKTMEAYIKKRESMPEPEPWTDEEFEEAMADLRNRKYKSNNF